MKILLILLHRQSRAYAPYFEEISPKPDPLNLKRGDIIGVNNRE